MELTPDNFHAKYEQVWNEEHNVAQEQIEDAINSTESDADGSSSGTGRIMRTSLVPGLFCLVVLIVMGF